MFFRRKQEEDPLPKKGDPTPLTSIKIINNLEPLPSGEPSVRMRYYVEYPDAPDTRIKPYDLIFDMSLIGSRSERGLAYLNVKIDYSYDLYAKVEYFEDLLAYGPDYHRRVISSYDGYFFGTRCASDEERHIAEETLLPPRRHLTILDCATEDIELDFKELFDNITQTTNKVRIQQLLYNAVEPFNMSCGSHTIDNPETSYNTDTITRMWETA